MKQITFNALLVFMLASFIQTAMNAQLEAMMTLNWENSMQVNPYTTPKKDGELPCIAILEDNILIIKAKSYFAYNDLENYPPVHLSYNWGGLYNGITPPIESSDLTLVNINGIWVYENVYALTINLGNSFCPESQYGKSVNFSFEVFMSSFAPNGLAIQYPYENFTNSDQIFSVDIFNIELPPYKAGLKSLCCGVVLDDSASDTPPVGYITNGNNLQNSTAEILEKKTKAASNASNSLSNHFSWEEKNSFAVAPNPFTDVLNIDYSEYSLEMDVEIIITDNLGRIQWQRKGEEASDLEISTTDWELGFYFVMISSEKNKDYTKLVKNSF